MSQNSNQGSTAVFGNVGGYTEPTRQPGTLDLTITAPVDNAYAVLTWDLDPDCLFYAAYAGLRPDDLVLVAGDLPGPGYSVTDLLPGTPYFFQVVGYVNARRAVASNVIESLVGTPQASG